MREVETLDRMRSGLAHGFAESGLAADRETFARVCGPVGRSARELAASNGWVVAQQADRYRSPANALDPEGREVYSRFERDRSLLGISGRIGWKRTASR